MREAIFKLRVQPLTDTWFWRFVCGDLLQSEVDPKCWTALVFLVSYRLDALPAEDLIRFLTCLTLNFPSYEQNRQIWRASIQGLPSAARLDPQLWELVGGRMTLENQTDFGTQGWRYLMELIPRNERENPLMWDAIVAGLPQLSSYRNELGSAILYPNAPQLPDEMEMENDSIFATEASHATRLTQTDDTQPFTQPADSNSEQVVNPDMMISKDSFRARLDDPHFVARLEQVQAVLAKYLSDVKGEVSRYSLTKRARPLLRKHGLSMTDEEFDAWMDHFITTQDSLVSENPRRCFNDLATHLTIFSYQKQTTKKSPDISFASSEGSTLVGTFSQSTSNMAVNEPQEAQPDPDSNPHDDYETFRKATEWSRQWTKQWAIKQKSISYRYNDLNTLFQELKQVPKEIKETPVFWGKLVAQAVDLCTSGHLSESWMSLCYCSLPAEATKNLDFWSLFVAPLPVIKQPISGVWKVLLEVARNCRDLWDPRFWREIGSKIPNSGPGTFGQSTTTAFSAWIDVFNVVSKHAKFNSNLWDAFRSGVPAMASQVEEMKRLLGT